jgi:hypothetical protein
MTQTIEQQTEKQNETKATPITRPLEPQSKAIVIGASSGIGAALVHELATRATGWPPWPGAKRN